MHSHRSQSKRRMAGIVAAILGLATSSLAYAGFRTFHLVQIDLISQSASGSIGDARNSADFFQYIGCSLSARNTSSHIRTSCGARNAAGVDILCDTDEDSFAPTVAAINDHSYIAFSWRSTNLGNVCTKVLISSESTTNPK